MKIANQKKTVIITSVNFPFGGAPANFLRLLYKGLNDNGKNVKVILQNGFYYGDMRFDNSHSKDYNFVFCGFKNRPSNFILKLLDTLAGIFIPLLFLIIMKIKRQINNVVIYNISTYQVLPTLLLCKIIDIDIHSYISEWYEKETITKKSLFGYIKLIDFQYRMKKLNFYFTSLIVTSHYLKNYYVNNGYGTNKIFILPNLVDLEYFNSEKPGPIFSNETIRIGYCGSPYRKDGIYDLLNAFAYLYKTHNNIELLVIGDLGGNNSVVPQLKKSAEELGIINKVIFTGLVSTERIPELLYSCDILTLARPSGVFAEAGFPTKIGEYFATKRPVVLTKVGDLAVYLEDKKQAVIVNPDNPEEFAKGIDFLIKNKKIADTIGYCGYIWALEKLEYKSVVNKLNEFLE
jgi:glycosyltransferase involved in cell wall biosynthesis